MDYRKAIWPAIDLQYPSLSTNLTTDIVIIGAGLTGLSIAYYLMQNNQDFIVLEAGKIGNGVSGKTTAHITVQHDDILNKYIKNFSLQKAKKIVSANLEAIDEIERIINQENINCDFSRVDSYLYTTKDDDKKITKEYHAAIKLGINCYLTDQLPATFTAKKALVYPNQAQFTPTKYLAGLAKAITKNGKAIYENSRVQKIGKDFVMVNNHQVKAKHIVIATHNPIIYLPGIYFAKNSYQLSHVLAVPTAQKLDAIYNCVDKKGYTYRQYQNYVIMAGEDKSVFLSNKSFSNAFKHQEEVFPGTVQAAWNAMDGTALDYLPYIGKYKKSNRYVATGYNKWGMTNSNIAGRIITSLICNQPNQYIPLYSPQRKIGLGIFKLLKNIMLTTYSYFTYLFKPTSKTCTHLGCQLKYNKRTRTYDCPCHGSRFDEKGEIVDGPATKNLKIKNKSSKKSNK